MNFPNGGRIFANRPEPCSVDFLITAAADVGGGGGAGVDYVVTGSGGGLITGCTRTAEGDMKIALSDPLAGFLGLRMITTRANSHLTMDNITNIAAVSDPHIDVTFVATGTDTDPDGATMYFILDFYRTTTT